jgi:hypothetical protein
MASVLRAGGRGWRRPDRAALALDQADGSGSSSGAPSVMGALQQRPMGSWHALCSERGYDARLETRHSVRLLALILAGLLCALVWLAVLVVTGFSTPVLGIGLLGVLMLMGRSA